MLNTIQPSMGLTSSAEMNTASPRRSSWRPEKMASRVADPMASLLREEGKPARAAVVLYVVEGQMAIYGKLPAFRLFC